MTKPEQGNTNLIRRTVRQGRRIVEVIVDPSTNLGREILNLGIPKARVTRANDRPSEEQVRQVLESSRRASEKPSFRNTK